MVYLFLSVKDVHTFYMGWSVDCELIIFDFCFINVSEAFLFPKNALSGGAAVQVTPKAISDAVMCRPAEINTPHATLNMTPRLNNPQTITPSYQGPHEAALSSHDVTFFLAL